MVHQPASHQLRTMQMPRMRHLSSSFVAAAAETAATTITATTAATDAAAAAAVATAVAVAIATAPIFPAAANTLAAFALAAVPAALLTASRGCPLFVPNATSPTCTWCRAGAFGDWRVPDLRPGDRILHRAPEEPAHTGGERRNGRRDGRRDG